MHLITAALRSSTFLSVHPGTFLSCIYCHQELSCDRGHRVAPGSWWCPAILLLETGDFALKMVIMHFKPLCKETIQCSEHPGVPCHLHLLRLPLAEMYFLLFAGAQTDLLCKSEMRATEMANNVCLDVSEFSLVFGARTWVYAAATIKMKNSVPKSHQREKSHKREIPGCKQCKVSLTVP